MVRTSWLHSTPQRRDLPLQIHPRLRDLFVPVAGVLNIGSACRPASDVCESPQAVVVVTIYDVLLVTEKHPRGMCLNQRVAITACVNLLHVLPHIAGRCPICGWPAAKFIACFRNVGKMAFIAVTSPSNGSGAKGIQSIPMRLLTQTAYALRFRALAELFLIDSKSER